MVTDEGEMVQISRIVLPEEEYLAKINADKSKEKQKPQVELREEVQDFKVNIKRISVNNIEHTNVSNVPKFITSIQFTHGDSRDKGKSN